MNQFIMNNSYKVAIIGGGTAGLAAAIFLTKKNGYDVNLFEKFESPKPLGAGIMLQPTGLACLASIDLDEKALNLGARIHNLYGKDVNGGTIFDLTYKDLKSHMFALGIHRGSLFSLLYDEVLRLKIKITTSSEIIDTIINQNKRNIIDKFGQEYGPFDLVIDASGMSSLLREKYGNVNYSKPYPYGAVWGVLEDPNQDFCSDYLQQRYDGASTMIGMLAIGKRPMDKKQTAAFFWSLPAKEYPQWKADGLEPWKERVTGYWPELDPYLHQFQSTDDFTFSQYNDTIMKNWDYDHLVFIGDSAHCTSPQLGQGANLGLIDALTLSACLNDESNINNALHLYNRSRKNHVIFYQLASRLLTPFFQSDSKAAAWVRNKSFGTLCKTPYIKTQMLRTLAGLKTGLFTHLNPGKWDKKYDLDQKK